MKWTRKNQVHYALSLIRPRWLVLNSKSTNKSGFKALARNRPDVSILNKNWPITPLPTMLNLENSIFIFRMRRRLQSVERSFICVKSILYEIFPCSKQHSLLRRSNLDKNQGSDTRRTFLFPWQYVGGAAAATGYRLIVSWWLLTIDLLRPLRP